MVDILLRAAVSAEDSKSLSNYIRAIAEYEKKNDAITKLVSYIENHDKSLIHKLCDGKIYLPSFIALKQLKRKYHNFASRDYEVEKLFDRVIKLSKNFYSNLIRLVLRSRQENLIFDKEFDINIKPIAQYLINSLINIKYRIRYNKTRTKAEIMKENEANRFKLNIKRFVWATIRSVNDLSYRLTLIHSTNPALMKKLYYSVTITTIAFFWLLNFFYISSISLTSSAIINLLTGVVIAVIAINKYPINDFGKTDISGRDIVAYKYKVFFNNYSNSKMIRIFTLREAGAKHEDI